MINLNIKADLHMHTMYSDGAKSLKEVIELAMKAKLDYISITDHDTLTGSLEAYNMKERYSNINFIIGVELSTENLGESVHVLGYFKNSLGLNGLDEFLEKQRKQRIIRAYKIKDALLKHFAIDLNVSFFDKHLSITRGTIANEIIKQGYNYTREEIFDKMLGNDCPAYYPSTKLSTKEGVELIQSFGGLAVLAHPCLLKKNKVEELLNLGFDGIEAIYPKNRNGDEEKFKSLAKDLNLIITAGNDFHDFNDPHHGQIGELSLKGKNLEKFLKKLEVL